MKKNCDFDAIINAWILFKRTWSERIIQNELFDNFDKYLFEGELTNKNYLNQIKKIVIINNNVKSIVLHTNILFIYTSPFYFKVGHFSYPVGILISQLIDLIINYILNNNSSLNYATHVFKTNFYEKDQLMQ